MTEIVKRPRPGRPRAIRAALSKNADAPFTVDDIHAPASEFGDRLVPLKVPPL